MKFAVLILAAALAACAPPPPQSIEITHAWARPSPGGVDIAAGYLTIVNHADTADELQSASSPRAGRIDLHVTEMSDGMMHMHDAHGLTVAPGDTLTLAPGGAHLMFQRLSAPFQLGETVPVTLHFAHAGDVQATLTVRQQEN
ncbi:MAG TPA: copper chaperone PCu(A)C [Caulobacterales bacterium]|nr:copper chaperone PCu(A)C [Caulobacterales bacterium]